MLSSVALLLTWLVPAVDPALCRFEFEERHMGVGWKLILYAPDQETADRAAELAFARVEELNSILSDYDPESELSKLSNSAGMGEAVKVSDDLWAVLAESQLLARRSDGAFDVTVGPLVKLWRRARRTGKLPPEDELAAARAATGHQFLLLDPQARTALLEKPGMRLDLGGIAMGYAVDEALTLLRRMGVTRALLDASGDIGVTDPPPGEKGWRVAVVVSTASSEASPVDRISNPASNAAFNEHNSPNNKNPAPIQPPQEQNDNAKVRSYRTLLLSNAAVTTSGDAFQHVEIAGNRYSHIVDPHTGLGLTDRSSVTIIARDCMTADSLATAASVLGPRAGLELVAATPGAEGLFVRQPKTELEIQQSRGWSRFEVAVEEPASQQP